MTALDRMQRSRIAAARTLTETFMENRDSGDLGDLLLEAYISTGKGDEYDVMSTVIDSIADMGFAIVRRGGDFAAIVDEARNGHATSVEAEIILHLKDAYREDKRGYESTMSFDDLLRIALGHNGIEMRNGDEFEYGAPSLR